MSTAEAILEMRVTRCGKQLLLDGEHLADVRDDETAERLAAVLNWLDESKYGPTQGWAKR